MKLDLLDKFKGSLIGVAIGDTLGAPFEGKIRVEILAQFNNFEEYLFKNKKKFNTITDDTQLTLHVAQALIQGSGFNLENFIREYIRWLDDPPIGPGYGCISSIQKLKYGIPWQEAASNSGGNGTAMRVAPIGLFFCRDIISLKNAAIQSSQITHSHPAPIAGSVIIARAIAFLVNKTPEKGFSIDEFFDFILSGIQDTNDKIGKEFQAALIKVRTSMHLSLDSALIKFSQIGVKPPYFIEYFLGKAFVHPYIISTVACVLFIFLKNLSSFKDCIFDLATAGGDTDTVAAIGGSLAGAYLGYNQIPRELISIVKSNKKIIKISEELFNKFNERYKIE